MTTAKQITHYRNNQTGELAPPHLVGEDDEGRQLYCAVEGWTPIDWDGNEVSVVYDDGGCWMVNRDAK